MLVSDLLLDAYRENNIIPIGKPLSEAQQAEGLRLLNTFLGDLFGAKLGVNLRTWEVPAARTSPVPARYPLAPLNIDLRQDQWPYPPANVRVLARATSPQTIYFPQHPSDGARLAYTDTGSTAAVTFDGNGRLVEGALTRTITPAGGSNAPVQWFYRQDLGSWEVLLPELGLDDETPLPKDFDDFFMCALAIRLGPRHGKQPVAGTVARYTEMAKAAKHRYYQSEAAVVAQDDMRTEQTLPQSPTRPW